jgi:protein regulator of cytokinesis 1
VLRLEQLKSSKMKELVIKKRLELEEICRQTHMVTEALSIMEDSVEAIESGKNFIIVSYFEGYCKLYQ